MAMIPTRHICLQAIDQHSNVDVLSEGGWRELTGIGSRTQLPVGRPQETLERALQHIHKECLAVLKADSSVSLKEIGERVSKITPEMFAQSCARE